jgi:multiple antibiotic resistance protein
MGQSASAVIQTRENKMLREVCEIVFLLVSALFPVVNPPIAGLAVLSVVPQASRPQRSRLARRVAINSFFILAASLSLGAYFLGFLGVSIPTLRVAGGLVIAATAWKLLQRNGPSTPAVSQSAEAGSASTDDACRAKAFYPLSLPITAGPGAISVAIALGADSPHLGLQPAQLLGAAIALAILCLSIYAFVRFAADLVSLIGATGTQIVTRLFAFALLCIGLEILRLGLSEAFVIPLSQLPALVPFAPH